MVTLATQLKLYVELFLAETLSDHSYTNFMHINFAKVSYKAIKWSEVSDSEVWTGGWWSTQPSLTSVGFSKPQNYRNINRIEVWKERKQSKNWETSKIKCCINIWKFDKNIGFDNVVCVWMNKVYHEISVTRCLEFHNLLKTPEKMKHLVQKIAGRSKNTVNIFAVKEFLHKPHNAFIESL